MTKRRDFFKQFFSHLHVIKEEAKGNRHFKLPDLWKLDHAKFRQMKFRVREGVAIHSNETEIHAILNEDKTMLLCTKGSEQEKMFRMMQQRLTVEEIANQLAAENASEEDAQFPRVREFLLSLIKHTICVPAINIHYAPADENGE